MANRFDTPNAFPSVTAKETNAAPPIRRPPWRTRTGVVGKFRKGPPLAKITSKDDLAKFFGDDNNNAPIAINQAMDNGIEEFVVSRAIADDTPAEITSRLTTAGTPRESYVDDSGDEATKGITVLAEYLSEVAEITPTTSDVYSIRKTSTATWTEAPPSATPISKLTWRAKPTSSSAPRCSSTAAGRPKAG